MKRSHGLMVLGLIVSAGLAIFGDKTPSDQAAEPPARRSDAAPVSSAARSAPAKPPEKTSARPQDKRKRPVTILALQPRATLIGRNGAGQSSEIFAGETAAPPTTADAVPAPSAEPSLPPLPFTYLGKKYENAKWEVYLSIGDQTYFVREGSVVEQNYAVNAIKPPIMTFTFLPLKKMQTLTIGEAD